MSNRSISWNRVFDADKKPLSVVDSRRRLNWVLAGFLLCVATVFSRMLWLEVSTGPQTRHRVTQLPIREVSLPAVRGSIVTRDGIILAEDRQAAGLTMHYRFLQNPPQQSWLRRQARRRLDRHQRRESDRVESEMAKLRVELIDLNRRLASLSGLSLRQWNDRRRRVQQRVDRIAESVNQRRNLRYHHQQSELDQDQADWNTLSTLERIQQSVHEALFDQRPSAPPAAIEVAEQQQYHLLVARLTDQAVNTIVSHSDDYPGVRIERQQRRFYPQGTLAAHLVGHLGRVGPEEIEEGTAESSEDWIGRMGLEKKFERELRGMRGQEIQETDRRGRQLSSRIIRPAQRGEQLTLTVDAQLQRTAERLLDRALTKAKPNNHGTNSSGGAIVILDCNNGEVLACAAAPRFDPNVMLGGNPALLEPLLNGSGRPLFDRATKMAIPPGSVMKLVTAVALLETGAVEAHEPFQCQGFLHEPDRQRCYLFRHHGVGHQRITLSDALAQSCNVYFFHHASRMGHRPLIDWTYRFGLGRATGIELPDQPTGQVPTPRGLVDLEDRQWSTSDTQALSIGQSSLRVTPLQIARVIAAVANGGRLIQPRLLMHQDGSSSDSPGSPVTGLSAATIETIKTGMNQAVSDPRGTAHAVLSSAAVAVAAKTGTAETGSDRGDHAWIAAYAPADAPRIALVVTLEHGGGGSSVAGPLAGRLVQRLDQLGYFSAPSQRVARGLETD